MQIHRPFSEADLEYITKHYQVESYKAIAAKLNRDPGVIWKKARAMGLPSPLLRYVCKSLGIDEARVRAIYLDLEHGARAPAIRAYADELGCSFGAIYSYARNHGINIVPVADLKVMRPCLGWCGTDFPSEGIYHRICPKCRERNATKRGDG